MSALMLTAFWMYPVISKWNPFITNLIFGNKKNHMGQGWVSKEVVAVLIRICVSNNIVQTLPYRYSMRIMMEIEHNIQNTVCVCVQASLFAVGPYLFHSSATRFGQFKRIMCGNHHMLT